MATTTKSISRKSATLGLLIAVFVLAGYAGYLVVRKAVTNTVEKQAIAIAEIVASQASTARSVYASEVADKLRKDGFGPHVNSADMPGFVPIPAQFLKLVGRASSTNADKLFEYQPVSKWNLEPSQGLSDDFLRWAWPQLETQDRVAATNAIDWQAVYRFEMVDGQRVLRYLAADPASQASCVQCHNAYEQSPEVVARRQAQSTQPYKQWSLHQLLGGISITIPLERAEMHAGFQIRETSVFVFGILIASFLSLMWFNWRLSKEEISLVQTRTELEKSELEARTANELLLAKQGVEQALAELSTYLRAIDQHALVSVTDRAGRILQVNEKFVAVSGYSVAELLGQDHRIINSGTHAGGFFAQMWDTISQGRIWRGTVCNRAKSGLLYWVDSTIVPLRDMAGDITRYISIRIDITDRKRAEEEILHMATHDALTALPNRSLLLDRVRQALEADRRDHAQAAVLFIDLDQFKAVNDSLGHDVGDKLLIEVGRRLVASVRAEDTVARQGGDEFIVFLPRLHDGVVVQALAEKLLQALSEPFHVQGMDLHIGASIGAALFPQDGLTVEELLRNSDAAMYRVKASGRNSFRFFLPHMNEQAAERYALIEELRRGLKHDELRLHYQPTVCMETGAIDTVEVLVRWQHPQRGMLQPDAFIGLAESSGLIVPLGDWVLRAACAQWVRWRDEGAAPPRLAVNLSAIQFHNLALVDRVAEILRETGMDAHRLELEITESSLMNQGEDVAQTLTRLSGMGISIAIDDFGTGYSSLSYLKRFPIDTLKIDRSFVRDIENDPDDAAIVTTVIAIAHSLKMRVTAEGVERQTQLDFLRERGCNHYQGFLFCKPLSPEALQARLRPAA